MTREEHKEHLLAIMDSMPDDACSDWRDSLSYAIKALEQMDKIKALGEELRKVREGIKDENVLIGFNMAVAICNKYLGESENKSGKEQDNGNDW